MVYKEIIDLLVRLEKKYCEASGIVLPRKSPWARGLVEFPLNLLGFLGGWFLRNMPRRWSFAWQEKILLFLSGRVRYRLGPHWGHRVKMARFLAKRCEESFGVSPAVVCLLSHPPVTREVNVLNYELIRHAYHLLKEFEGYAHPIRQVVAIDRFGLDAVPLVQECFYAGLMRGGHLGFDRQPWLRRGFQRKLFERSGYGRMAYSLVEALKKRERVVIVLSGGVYENARLLYTAREHFWALRQKAESSARNRDQERNLFSLLAAESEESVLSAPYRTREVPSSLEATLEEYALSLGYSREQARKTTQNFKKEFGRDVPWRARFFQFLIRRVVQKRVPVLLLPLSHGTEFEPQMSVGEPVVLLPIEKKAGNPQEHWGRIWKVSPQGGQIQEKVESVQDFAQAWVSENFN
ncbi:MAG: hypothetical protein HY399_06575 [Elusimicrobia bacterium]|nr:hypothetical protein [Elusimicrobiota bacterium]